MSGKPQPPGAVALCDDLTWAEVQVGDTWARVDRVDLRLVIHDRWHLTSKGYVKSGRGLMHRVILGLADDDPRQVDHENQDKLDNQRANLRIATREQNGANRTKFMSREFSSAYKGVCRYRGRWQAVIRVDGKLRRLGFFDDEVEAARAYDQAALDAWGPYACLNYAGVEDVW